MAQTTFKWPQCFNFFNNHKSVGDFPFSFRPLQFGFHRKMSFMFNPVMIIETLTSFEILDAEVTFDTLMPFQLCLFHEVWQTLGTFEGFCFNCQLGFFQFFFKQGFLLCNILQSLFFIIWNFGILIFLSRRKIGLIWGSDCGSGEVKTGLHPGNIKVSISKQLMKSLYWYSLNFNPNTVCWGWPSFFWVASSLSIRVTSLEQLSLAEFSGE